MVTATGTRSSLELMLDKLQQIEEQPNAIPPALPARPVSRARPRRGRRNGERESCVAGFDDKETRKNEDIVESDASAAQFLHFPEKKTEELGNLRGGEEKGICKIQKCYRGHRVRCCYTQLTREVIALQSFIRGENARKGYEERCGIHRAIIIIQKQGRKYLQHQAALKYLLQSDSGSLDQKHRNEIEDETRVPVPYASFVDLQKRVVRTEAKLRAKKEENVALKRKLIEMEKRWRTCEERMTFMEKEWQDQLTYIQERLAETKKNPSPSPSPSPFSQTRFSNRFKSPDCCTVKSGIPKGRRLYNIPINSNNNNNGDEEMNEDGEEQVVCLKLRLHEELRKLKMRFKEWKKEYKNKLRDTQSTFNKLANTESSKTKSHNNWWGRLSN